MTKKKTAQGTKTAGRLTLVPYAKAIELDKRVHVPVRAISTCPECGKAVTIDLGNSGAYLSYPKVNGTAKIYFYHEAGDDSHEWQHEVTVRVTLEPV